MTRIKTIELKWFRGAAQSASLEPNGNSMVVYGANGSGKSSFVDAVEYEVQRGRVQHLAHEYSGKRQEKAIVNTHKPPDARTELRICFEDGTEVTTRIKQNGASKSLGDASGSLRAWDYQRTILRQDEVADFIGATKGNKYSALLPLLGLHSMEVAAENLRQLSQSVETTSQLKESQGILGDIKTRRQSIFGTASDQEILAKLRGLHREYCPDDTATTDPKSVCAKLEAALRRKQEESEGDLKRHIALEEVAKLDIKERISGVRTASLDAAGAAERLISEKLEVLKATALFTAKLETVEGEIECPACGRSIAVGSFQAHVRDEQDRLSDALEAFNTRRTALKNLSDTIVSLKGSLARSEVGLWWSQLAAGELADNSKYLQELDTEALRRSCDEAVLEAIETNLQPVLDAAASVARNAPPGAKLLSTQIEMARVGNEIFSAFEKSRRVRLAEALISFLNSLERSVRLEIRRRSQTVIDQTSSAIQRMWAYLHPEESIEDIRLYFSEDADKAIDIKLKFHGVEQDSPRLTLSEGYRNSLGLSIFLAMAKQGEQIRPLLLDDVVVSLDREHRGMIAKLLTEEFGNRQVIILTHDREWFTELRQQLDGNAWTFRALLPYHTPDVGIRWSHKSTNFGDARAQLDDRPDSAANDARKVMDLELALIAEKLDTKLPYRRGEKNDRRMAHEFLVRLCADGKRCFQRRSGESYEQNTEAIEAFESADRLLITWGNKGSHKFDIIDSEAKDLIEACERALSSFACSGCGKFVWFARANKWVQCQCAQLRWRLDKA